MTATPLIGVTLDSEKGADPALRPGAYSRFPWYAVRENYFSAIVRAGGIPVGIGHDTALADSTIGRLDGLVVTGGAFDLDPAMFGEAAHPATVIKPDRTRAEVALLRAALARDLPVLGICGGMQLLAVMFGGRLIQHIPDAVPDALAHEQPNPRNEAGHTITIAPDSRLEAIVRGRSMAVNSAHHQAVLTPGRLAAVAHAPDGVIEAVEDSRRRFCLGVQWHPEFGIDTGDERIFTEFVSSSGGAECKFQ